MKMEAFIKRWEGQPVEDCGSYVGAEWKAMFRDLRSAVESVCQDIGARLVTLRPGHYDGSGFVERDGKFVYLSMGQDALRGRVALTKPRWAGPVLIRTAAHAKDFTGGPNHFVTLNELGPSLDALLKKGA